MVSSSKASRSLRPVSRLRLAGSRLPDVDRPPCSKPLEPPYPPLPRSLSLEVELLPERELDPEVDRSLPDCPPADRWLPERSLPDFALPGFPPPDFPLADFPLPDSFPPLAPR